MNASDISFGQVGDEVSLGIDALAVELDDNSADLELGNLDLGDLDHIYDAESSEPTQLTGKQKLDAIVEKLSANPSILQQLSKGVTDSKLGMLSHSVGFDVVADYNSSDAFNIFINALAQGYICGDNFRDVVPCGIKLHYVPESKSDSVHLFKTGDYEVYKSTPAIRDFSEEAISKLSPLFKGKLDSFSSLYKLLQDCCHKPVVVGSANDSTSILAFDNLTLAKKVAKSRSWKKSIAILKQAGCDDERLKKISILAKSIKDNK